MSGNPFKSLPTFDVICARLAEAESCIKAQGNVIEWLLNEMQEREYEITFLMNISHVVIPQSKIADANGKIPAIRKSARDVYQESGRAAVVSMFEARAKAIADAENLSQAERPSEEPAVTPEDGKDTPIEFRVTGKTTH